MKKFWLLCGLFLTNLGYAKQTIKDLLHTTDSSQAVVVFYNQAAQDLSINKLKMHLLTATDCYSGYKGVIEILSSEGVKIKSQELVALDSKALYLALTNSLGTDEALGIHSILIRMQQSQAKFMLFTGSCSDQKINCCVPVQCSTKTKSCDALFNLPIQPVMMELL